MSRSTVMRWVLAVVVGGIASTGLAQTNYYVRYGGPYGDGSGTNWANAKGELDAAWDVIQKSGTYNIYIEKTTGNQSYERCVPFGSKWYNCDITINHYGGLTPADSGTGWVHNAGDVSYVKSTDADEPAFRVSKGYGVGNYGMDECHMRFDDMIIEGGANMSAIMFNAIGRLHDDSSLRANRTTFIAGNNSTNPCIVFSAAGCIPN